MMERRKGRSRVGGGGLSGARPVRPPQSKVPLPPVFRQEWFPANGASAAGVQKILLGVRMDTRSRGYEDAVNR